MRRRSDDNPITAEELREFLSYELDTGVFRWKVKGCGRGIGNVAGCINKVKKYNYIHINGQTYMAHRLAWLYMNGSFPKHQIDHINGIKNDNRAINLREVSNRENCCNRKIHRSGKLIGCSYSKDRKKWVAAIKIEGKTKYIGIFKSEEAAHHTYLIWKHNLGL